MPESTERLPQALSDSELDVLVAGEKEKILTDPFRLQKEIDSIIPTINEDIDNLYLSLGMTAPPALAPTDVNYFFDHHRFYVESASDPDVSGAFEKNKAIFICLHCMQERLRGIDSDLGARELLGLPPQYGFFLVQQLYTKYILHHENLHRIHEFSKKDVPSPTREMAVAALEGLLQDRGDLTESDPEAEGILASVYEGLTDAKQRNTLEVLQEGALFILKSKDDVIVTYGKLINEALIGQVAKTLTLERLKTDKSSLIAFGKTLLSEIYPSEFTEAQIEKFLRQSGQRRLISFLSSNLFDGMLNRPTKRNIIRFLALLWGKPEFFTV